MWRKREIEQRKKIREIAEEAGLDFEDDGTAIVDLHDLSNFYDVVVDRFAQSLAEEQIANITQVDTVQKKLKEFKMPKL